MGILNAPRNFFLLVYGPILKLQGLEGVGFQGKKLLFLTSRRPGFLVSRGRYGQKSRGLKVPVES